MAERHNQSKLEHTLAPIEAIEDMVRGFMYGAYWKKPTPYGPNNWRTPPYFTKDVLLNSLERHIAELRKGNELDLSQRDNEGRPLPHIAFVLANAAMYSYCEQYSLFNPGDLEQAWRLLEDEAEKQEGYDTMAGEQYERSCC